MLQAATEGQVRDRALLGGGLRVRELGERRALELLQDGPVGPDDDALRERSPGAVVVAAEAPAGAAGAAAVAAAAAASSSGSPAVALGALGGGSARQVCRRFSALAAGVRGGGEGGRPSPAAAPASAAPAAAPPTG